MIIEALAVGAFQANCYLLGCGESREALLIDPGDDAHAIESALQRHELKPVAYLLTHGHVDHVGAATPLREKLGGEILLHEADLSLYKSASQQALAYGTRLTRPQPPDRFLTEGETITWGQLRGVILHTPGHSPGGICLQVPGELMPDLDAARRALSGSGAPPDDASDAPRPDWVFCGDTLFQGSIGRTDLPGGSYAELMKSIKERLLGLPDETIIAPGHGPVTTIGTEKQINPFLEELL